MLAVYRKKVLSRRTFTSSSFFNFSRWCESVEFGISSSDWILPATKPSGCADRSNCMIRSRGSAPIAESMSANFATCSVLFLLEATGIFRYLQKYGHTSSKFGIAPERRATRKQSTPRARLGEKSRLVYETRRLHSKPLPAGSMSEIAILPQLKKA